MNLTIPQMIESSHVIIQGRMNSSRLPGKILLEIAGKPMLQHVIERAQKAQSIGKVIVATTTDPSDDPVAEFCSKNQFACYRGSLLDVLDRYYQASVTFNSHAIVRLTGDCPLIDPQIIDQTVLAFWGQFSSLGDISEREYRGISRSSDIHYSLDSQAFDFACSRLPPPWKRTYPIGQDVEVCSLQALECAWKEANLPYHREHVMPYLYEECRSVHYTITLGNTLQVEPCLLPTAPLTSSNPFRVLVLNHDPDYGNQRWTVDTPVDLEFIRQVFKRFPEHESFNWLEIVHLLEREPELMHINTQTRAKDYREVDERMAMPRTQDNPDTN